MQLRSVIVCTRVSGEKIFISYNMGLGYLSHKRINEQIKTYEKTFIEVETGDLPHVNEETNGFLELFTMAVWLTIQSCTASKDKK